jgi:hypothetical protein
MITTMTAILYPVAANADAALAAPVGRAARAREAERLAGEPTTFVTEPAGPAFATREAALDAYAGRLEDDRPGRAPLAVEDRYCDLTETVAPGARRPVAVRPSFADGRRWPEPPEPHVRTAWRITVSYWRPVSAAPLAEPPQARRARRRGEAADLAPDALRAMARQPLRPVEPQRPLDIGLFETRLPESPHIVVPDE